MKFTALFAAAAQLIGGVPQHDQLKGPGVLPGVRRVIGVPLGRGGVGSASTSRMIGLYSSIRT